jgi:hypothetical protein
MEERQLMASVFPGNLQVFGFRFAPSPSSPWSRHPPACCIDLIDHGDHGGGQVDRDSPCAEEFVRCLFPGSMRSSVRDVGLEHWASTRRPSVGQARGAGARLAQNVWKMRLPNYKGATSGEICFISSTESSLTAGAAPNFPDGGAAGAGREVACGEAGGEKAAPSSFAIR